MTNASILLEKLEGLRQQAIEEKSHYYTHSVCGEAIKFIKAAVKIIEVQAEALEYYSYGNNIEMFKHLSDTESVAGEAQAKVQEILEGLK